MTCKRKHVKYEPTEEDWRCPKCHKGCESFTLDSELSDGECELLHEDDTVQCFECGYTSTGKKISALFAKKNNVVTCPCCKGKGWVKNDGKQEASAVEASTPPKPKKKPPKPVKSKTLVNPKSEFSNLVPPSIRVRIKPGPSWDV